MQARSGGATCERLRTLVERAAVTAAPSTITTISGARRHAASAAAPTPTARASSTSRCRSRTCPSRRAREISAAGTSARQRVDDGRQPARADDRRGRSPCRRRRRRASSEHERPGHRDLTARSTRSPSPCPQWVLAAPGGTGCRPGSPRVAHRIGTPTGVNGISTRQIAAPSEAGPAAGAVAQLRRDHRHEGGREGGVEAVRLRVDRRRRRARRRSVPMFQNT